MMKVMYVQIGAQPDHDFHNPLGLLSDCHRRIERFLAALLKVAEQAGENKLSSLHRHALEAGLTYFREAAPLHTLDEDESLFPRLQDSPTGRRALEWISHLSQEHQQADTWHAEVEELGQEWLRSGKLSPEKRQRMRSRMKSLHDLYVVHIKLEDERVFPLAAQALSSDHLLEIGREMAQRRGVAFLVK